MLAGGGIVIAKHWREKAIKIARSQWSPRNSTNQSRTERDILVFRDTHTQVEQIVRVRFLPRNKKQQVRNVSECKKYQLEQDARKNGYRPVVVKLGSIEAQGLCEPVSRVRQWPRHTVNDK